MFRDVYKWVYEAWHLTLQNWVYKTTSKRTQTWLEPKSDQQYICQMPNYIPHPPTSIPKNTTHKMHWARGYLNAYVLQKNNIDKSHRNSKQGRIYIRPCSNTIIANNNIYLVIKIYHDFENFTIFTTT